MPNKPITELSGKRFGKLQVLWPAGRKGKPLMIHWVVQCDDGNIRVVSRGNLTTGNTTSCGCTGSRRTIGARSTTHGRTAGKANPPEYETYKGAKRRCNNPRRKDYGRYGGRGIKFLFTSFEQFISEVGERPSAQHSIDRINNNGHYEPGNVRWATVFEQNRNQRPRTRKAI